MYPISLNRKTIHADLDGFPSVGNPDGFSGDGDGDADSGDRPTIDVGTPDTASE